jgi:hypothetical protein
VAAGLLARLPISMLGIGIVFLVEGATGSYGLAGAVAATFGVVQAAASPLLAGAVDRYGQARVMLPAIGVHVIGLLLLLASSVLHAPRWTTFAAAAVAGGTIGSIGALVRARWSYVLAGSTRRGALLHTAFSLESVLDEVVFITGPILVTALAVGVTPVAGIVTAAAAVAIGGTALMLQRSTEPAPSHARPVQGTGVLRSRGMIVLVVAFVCVGGIFGAVDVATVAFTAARGVPGRRAGYWQPSPSAACSPASATGPSTGGAPPGSGSSSVSSCSRSASLPSCSSSRWRCSQSWCSSPGSRSRPC